MSIVLPGPVHAIPPEVWSHILHEVPKPNLPQLLQVCSLFHDIVIWRLFSSIKIYFIGSERGAEMLNMTHQSWIDECSRKLMSKSWEILNRICRDPRFAKVVKSLSVIAFGDGASIFERMTVSNSLKFMPNLQTFRWFGVGPDFDTVVAEHLPSTLQRLDIKSSLPTESLQHLQNLTTLNLSIPFFYPDDEEAHDQWKYDEEIGNLEEIPAEVIFETFTNQLTCLRITASQLRGVPIRVLSGLRSLDIVSTIGDVDELVGLDLVFHHAASLESLSLVGYLIPELFSFLPPFATSGALPRLTSCLLCSSDYGLPKLQEGAIFSLCLFLQNRPRLRRLYLRLPNIEWDGLHQFLPVIKTFPNLDVLGIHTGYDPLNEVHLQVLLPFLPTRLRALHLAITWSQANLLILVDEMGRFPKLSFLHIYDTDGRPPILLEDLVNVAKSLKTVGLNRALWDIDRVGSEIVTNKWPRWKIKFCVEEDFPCEDDFWLFQYN